MKISIIIPTLNEGKYLPKLLESIKKQDFRDYEIIVGDAHSTDNTRKIAKKYGAKIVDGGMPAVGRNNGAKIAKGEYLFFFDADVKLPKHFLKNALNEMNKRKIELATCSLVPISNLLIDRVLHDMVNLFIKINQFVDPHAAGCCIFVRKDLFLKVGGFNESLKLGEDNAFVKKASKIKPFRVLNSVKAMLSVRRLRKEGRLNLAGKYIKVDLHRFFTGEIEHDFVEYQFGDFNKKDFNKKDDKKKLMEIERNLIKIDREYQKISKGIRDERMRNKNAARLRRELDKTLRPLIKAKRKKKEGK